MRQLSDRHHVDPGATRFYAAGPNLNAFSELNQYGLDVRPLGDEIGLASAIKMCYASLTKGLTALCTELLTAAEVLGVSDALTVEFQLSQSALYERMERGLPSMPPKARRWIGEMEEISATFKHIGLTPNILTGAADMYRLVSETHLADLSPERARSVSDVGRIGCGLGETTIDILTALKHK